MLCGRKRYDEFEAFLAWLVDTISLEEVDVLVVAGDVFDNTAPSNRAQQLYYQFLGKVAKTPCRHVVVVAGNHDSPSFLDAPRDLLSALNVHVIGSVSPPFGDEVIVLRDDAGNAELIVCAVPYLRDRDIRTAEAGESVEDKDRKLLEGIRSHYDKVCEMAVEKRNSQANSIPIVATGHLFTVGAQTTEGDGVRDLYVGSLAHIAASAFPHCIDYLALGHLHVPQKVGGTETMRYSGSPLPMSFGEAGQEKSVCVVDFTGANAAVRTIVVPTFQNIDRIAGSWNDISERITHLVEAESDSWLEIIYEGSEVIGDLRGQLENLVAGSQIEILRIKDSSAVVRAMSVLEASESLEDLDVYDVFSRCLEAGNVPDDQRKPLTLCYREAITAMQQHDANAE
jgi:exonuclease SbcD